MKIHRSAHVLLTTLILTGGAPTVVGAADTPSPTATPRPRTLGDIRLKRVDRADEDGRIVISDANLGELSGRGIVTVGGTGPSKSGGGEPRKTPSRSVREKWRNAVLRQKRVIAELERKSLSIAARIDLIEDGRLTARALAQLERTEIELEAAEREIRDAKAELGRIVREARRHGAEPGWFR